MPTRTDPVTAVERYTLCALPAAEARVAQDLSRIAAGLYSEIGDRVRAIVVVGSFARAEGSVVYLDDEEPHADPGYQLLALFERKPERERTILRDFSASWTRLLRTRVDVRGYSLSQLTSVPPTLFWFHVGCGQRVTLVGDPTAIFAVPPRTISELSPSETVRVMTEATVALALVSLQGDASRPAILDCLHRVALAYGDSALLQRGQYRESLHERACKLRDDEPCEGLSELYDAAIAYRSDPHRPLAQDLSERWLEQLRAKLSTVQLTLEAQRIGSPRDPEAYARFRWRDSEPPRGRLSRVVRLLKGRPPRPERLLRAAVALAFDRHNEAARAVAARILHHRTVGAAGASDQALALALRSLAREVLHDPWGRPFTRWRTEPRGIGEWLLQRTPGPLGDAAG